MIDSTSNYQKTTDAPVLKKHPKRLVVALSGASGAGLGVEFLKALEKLPDWQVHLIISKAAERTLWEETGLKCEDAAKLADKTYPLEDIGASIASGTFQTEGMVIIPCSMNTLGKIAAGISDNLILRAADVTLKERRKLLLVARESPLSSIHLQNMLNLSRAGAVILPPVLAFYQHPATVDDLIKHTVGKALDIFQINASWFRRWGE